MLSRNSCRNSPNREIIPYVPVLEPGWSHAHNSPQERRPRKPREREVVAGKCPSASRFDRQPGRSSSVFRGIECRRTQRFPPRSAWTGQGFRSARDSARPANSTARRMPHRDVRPRTLGRMCGGIVLRSQSKCGSLVTSTSGEREKIRSDPIFSLRWKRPRAGGR
jgi:hypothetical protein